MKTKVSPAVVGVFVLGALALGLIALFSFGGVNFFSKPQRFVVYFDETIHGLDLGSPVKLRGVRVGRVASINLRYNAAANQSVVAVVCELSRNILSDERGLPIDVSNRLELERLIDRGLRAQLGVIGLATGLLYVELDFFDITAFPMPEGPRDDRYALMPPVPSTISQFQASFTEILANMKQIDFGRLASELQGLLGDVRKQLNGLDSKALVAEWTQAGASLNALTTDPEIKTTLTNVNGAVTDLRALLTKIDAQVEPAAEGFTTTLAEARGSLESFERVLTSLGAFVNAQQGLGDGASQAFHQLAEAAASVQRLADFLERNPGALLTGRRPPETPPAR